MAGVVVTAMGVVSVTAMGVVSVTVMGVVSVTVMGVVNVTVMGLFALRRCPRASARAADFPRFPAFKKSSIPLDYVKKVDVENDVEQTLYMSSLINAFSGEMQKSDPKTV